MKNKNIGINAFLNVIKYSMAVLFPLISYPYAFRALGAEGIGKVTYSNSILSYFSLLATFGISTYAIREGSKKKNDKSEFNQFANEMFTINSLFTLVSYVLLSITIISVEKLHPYITLIAIQSISLALTTLGVDWINTVYEDYAYITIRSVFAHILSLCLLFAFVKTPNDCNHYALLSISTNGLTCLLNWFYCKKYARIHLINSPNFRKHIKPLFYIFINTITISIYVNSDTTILGWFKGDYYVGVYSVPVKIYTIIKNIMIAIYAVGIPRLSMYIGKQEIDEYKKLITNLWNTVSMLLWPVAVGLICFSGEAMSIMGGLDFAKYRIALQVLSVSLIFAIYGGLVTAVINLTLGREKDNMIGSFLGAIFNFIANLFFIPKYGIYGAAFTTLLSELIVFVFCFFRIPKKNELLDFYSIKRTSVHIIGSSAAMGIVVFLLKQVIQDLTMKIIVIIPFAFLFYCLMLWANKESCFLSIINLIKEKVKTRYLSKKQEL